MEADVLDGIEAQIAAYRDLRAAAERFSDAFWEADDELMWWRHVRDAARRTGHVPPDAIAALGRVARLEIQILESSEAGEELPQVPAAVA